VDIQCGWCHLPIEVDRAGWPYIHSVALVHLHVCSSRPVDATADTIEATASRIADALDKEFRGC